MGDSSDECEPGCSKDRNGHKGGFPVMAETTRNHIFFKRNQSSDNRSHGFGAKFLLKKLSASDFNYERKSALRIPVLGNHKNPPGGALQLRLYGGVGPQDRKNDPSAD